MFVRAGGVAVRYKRELGCTHLGRPSGALAFALPLKFYVQLRALPQRALCLYGQARTPSMLVPPSNVMRP